MGRIAATLACALALAGCKSKTASESKSPPASASTVQDQAPEATKLKLVVLLVVDQLPSWSFDRDVEHARAGFRRLIEGGVWYRRARYPYASTYTASGHAALGTGTPPAVSGILANRWYRRDTGQVVSAIADPNAPLLAVTGAEAPSDSAAASPVQLRSEGIADVLAREKRGRSVAVALKARGAVLVLGQRPTMAVWYDPNQPAMTTSRYFADAPPAWLTKLAREKPIARFFDHVWAPTTGPDELRAITGISDGAEGEGGLYGLDNAFPHELASSEKPAKALRATPAGNQITVDTALAAVDGEQLGADDVPDMLAVSFSAHDYAGHYWGQESWERFEIFLDTDRAIGELLDGLDARVGADSYAVVMSSDHGATRLVEHTRKDGSPARRVMTTEVKAAATRAAERVLGKGAWVVETSTSNVYLSRTFAALPPARRKNALNAMVKAISKIPDIGFAGSTKALIGRCETREGVEALACRSLRDGESGELYFAAGPNCVCTTEQYTTGTTHGSPNPDDTDVRVVVYVPGRASRVVDELVSPLQVAPTIAELLGVSPPAQTEALPLR